MRWVRLLVPMPEGAESGSRVACGTVERRWESQTSGSSSAIGGIKGEQAYSANVGGLLLVFGACAPRTARQLKSSRATRSHPPDRGLFGCLTVTDARDRRGAGR
jgi:hypothetical protein